MSKYVIVRKNDKDIDEFLRELHGDDAYTDDLGCALEFDTEYEASRETIDDEFAAKLILDEDGGIVGYEPIEEVQI